MSDGELVSPLISIVIPCFNQAAFLPTAVESCLAQTYPQCEIIVVDDGSTDDTSVVAARFPGVLCVRQNNAGLSAARNAGIKASSGRYLVFLDADDRLLPDAVQCGLDCFRECPDCAFVSGHFRYISEDGSVEWQFTQRPLETDPYEALLKRNYIGMHATVMYQRQILELIGGFDISLKSCEDYDMYLRIARKHDVRRYARVVAEYRRHEAAMSVDAARMLRGAMAVLGKQWDNIRSVTAHVRAYRTGIRNNRRTAVLPLLVYFRRSLSERRWPQTLRLARKFAAYLPVWLYSVWLDACLSTRLVVVPGVPPNDWFFWRRG